MRDDFLAQVREAEARRIRARRLRILIALLAVTVLVILLADSSASGPCLEASVGC